MTSLGKTLLLNLTTRQARVEAYDEGTVRRFLGGRGAGVSWLREHLAPGADPLGPHNPLVLSAGLLTGTDAPASSRLHLIAKSPLTGLLGSSNVGGHFGAALRAAGYQMVVLEGSADRPVVVHLDAEGARIDEAAELWGLDAWATRRALQDRGGGEATQVMAIGPGGERLVRYACIMADRGHAAGRTGLGAVMGAKQVKAIAVRTPRSRERPSEQTRQAVREYAAAIRAAPRYPIYAKYSNSAFVTWADEMGFLATRNYQANRFAQAAAIDGQSIIEYVTRAKSCHRCPVHCKAEISITSGEFAGTEGERPDIEPIIALGSKCGLADVEALLHLYNLCGQLGIDVISAGSALAFAMDLRENGIVSAPETNGIDLTWGNHRAMDAMLRAIARREGFGDLLADGVARAAQRIGRGAERYAYHSKGLELTAYDPRGAMGTALGYAVSSRGADFTSVYAVPEYRWDAEQGRQVLGDPLAVDRGRTEGKGRLIRHTMAVSAALDSLGLCKVAALSVLGDFSLQAEARLTAAITGLPCEAADLFTVGERVVTAERSFNLAQGATARDDTLPALFLERGLAMEPNRGRVVALRPMLADFYSAMGWDSEGRPTEAKLRELGLSD